MNLESMKICSRASILMQMPLNLWKHVAEHLFSCKCRWIYENMSQSIEKSKISGFGMYIGMKNKRHSHPTRFTHVCVHKTMENRENLRGNLWPPNHRSILQSPPESKDLPCPCHRPQLRQSRERCRKMRILPLQQHRQSRRCATGAANVLMCPTECNITI